MQCLWNTPRQYVFCPSSAIQNESMESKDVKTLCNIHGQEQINATQLADNIQNNGLAIAELLKNLLNMSDEDIRKEADYA